MATSTNEYKAKTLWTLAGLGVLFGWLILAQPSDHQPIFPAPDVKIPISEPWLPMSKSKKIEKCKEDSECHILAEAIVYEARGESLFGQYAVGSVILNRVDSPRFPDTIKDVVYQRHQFEYVMNKDKQRPGQQAWDKAYVVAYELLSGMFERVTHTDHYLNPSVVSRMPRWTHVYDYQMTIGNHDFYMSKRGM